jgi:uncharacterized protein YyaL (SSP411 family)
MTHTNRLIHATSPYLLQHAHNPVDWYEWGAEALSKAVQEDKPILVSIGYSSCHWCHVMERESFENEDIARVMNEHFVCIKVDREERPDIDHIYMDAVQALGVNGGWPLNVFLTPQQKPFFGGTYFAPPSWTQILTNLYAAFQANRTQVEATAEELRLHLLRSEVERFRQAPVEAELVAVAQGLYQKLSPKFDPVWGGMSRAPKFIMPAVWQWLLRYHVLTGQPEALHHTLLTLKKIAMGGIYDQIGGGFARYSVDGEWFAPHFEKMLYDNAQLLSLYAEAYALTHDPEFRTVITETVGWLTREMTSPAGGFYSALDADSEGEEGKYYVWTYRDLEEALGEHAPLVAEYYAAQPTGNWEHGQNILTRLLPDKDFLKQQELGAAEWQAILQQSKDTLLQKREGRPHPGLDDKIITAWNAMTIVGLTDAYRALGAPALLTLAEQNMRFLENELLEGQQIYRSYKDRRSHTRGFLDDYAYLIQAYRKLYEVTFNEYWLRRAAFFLETTLTLFFDPADHCFYYTAHDGEALIARKKEIFDNVIPSSNALMAQNLWHLGVLLDRDDWKERGRTLVSGFSRLIADEPNYMAYWATVYLEMEKGMAEIVLLGAGLEDVRMEMQREYLPFAVFMGAISDSKLPLIADKTVIDGKTTVYVCYNKACRLPVYTVPEALQQLKHDTPTLSPTQPKY